MEMNQGQKHDKQEGNIPQQTGLANLTDQFIQTPQGTQQEPWRTIVKPQAPPQNFNTAASVLDQLIAISKPVATTSKFGVLMDEEEEEEYSEDSDEEMHLKSPRKQQEEGYISDTHGFTPTLPLDEIHSQSTTDKTKVQLASHEEKGNCSSQSPDNVPGLDDIPSGLLLSPNPQLPNPNCEFSDSIENTWTPYISKKEKKKRQGSLSSKSSGKSSSSNSGATKLNPRARQAHRARR